jgi:hypothetical protein
MKKKHALAAASVLVLVLTVPMTSSVGHAQPVCDSGNRAHHCVDVVITNGAIQSPPDVVVPGKNHQIYWQIKTSGYTFPKPPKPAGIAWKASTPTNDNGRMPANEFQCNRVSDTVVHCTDAVSTLGSQRKYEYKITVIDPAGNPVILDPWVINR